MTGLWAALDDYLAIRRAAGYKLERDEKLLRQFLSYCDDAAAATITTDVAVGWATLPEDPSPVTRTGFVGDSVYWIPTRMWSVLVA